MAHPVYSKDTKEKIKTNIFFLHCTEMNNICLYEMDRGEDQVKRDRNAFLFFFQ